MQAARGTSLSEDLPPEAVAEGGARRGLLLALATTAVVVFIADQATKAWAVANLEVGEWRPLLGEWIQLTLVYNAGAALSIGTGFTWALTLVAVVVTVVIVRSARRIGSRAWAVALGLLLGGALGNLYDRFFREPGPARGEVVDFIAYVDWFVGNVADIAIVVAAGMIVLLSLRGIRLDGTRAVAEHAPAPEPTPDVETAPGPDGDA